MSRKPRRSGGPMSPEIEAVARRVQCPSCDAAPHTPCVGVNHWQRYHRAKKTSGTGGSEQVRLAGLRRQRERMANPPDAPNLTP